MALTAKQEVFCKEYVISLNATDAAKKAGYSEKTAKQLGSKTLSNVDVIAEIQRLNKKRFKKLDNEGENVIKELAKIGFSNISDYLTIDDEGCTKLKPLSEMKNTGVISSVKEKRVIKQAPGDSKDMILDNTFEFKMWDKNKALENLGKHYNLFAENINLNMTEGKSIVERIRKEMNGEE